MCGTPDNKTFFIMGDSAYKPPSGQMNDTLDAGLGNLVGAPKIIHLTLYTYRTKFSYG